MATLQQIRSTRTITSAAATPSPVSAMLRLRSSILTRVLASSSASFPKNSSLQRLLFATAAQAIFPGPSFDLDDYLVDTCGLTGILAHRAFAKLSHLNSISKPDAVRAFLAGLGLSSADVTAAVAKDPQILYASVDKTLASNIPGLTGLGLSRSEVARLLSLAPKQFRNRTIVPKMQHYLPLFGSSERLLWTLRFKAYILSPDLDKAVKPNTMFLRECGLSDGEIADLSSFVRGMLSANPEHVQATVACAEGLGVPRGSAMFGQALRAIGFRSQEKLAARVKFLKKTFTWSDADVRIAICTCPKVLSRTKEFLQHRANYLISELGLDPAYVACNLKFMGWSWTLQEAGRMIPRHYVVKFLKKNGLLDRNDNTDVRVREEIFMEKFIHSHKEAAPYLAEDYAAACRGQVHARFKNLP